MLAMVIRIVLLLGITWIMGLSEPLIQIFNRGLSGRDLILLFGGLFLLGKSTHEIHANLEGDQAEKDGRAPASFAGTIAQILLIDIVFSLDSVITPSAWPTKSRS